MSAGSNPAVRSKVFQPSLSLIMAGRGIPLTLYKKPISRRSYLEDSNPGVKILLMGIGIAPSIHVFHIPDFLSIILLLTGLRYGL